MESVENLMSPKLFYEDLDKKMSENLSKLNEMLDNVLEMRANCGRLMLELKVLYDPKYLQELYTLTEEDEVKDFKRYIDLVKDLSYQPFKKRDKGAEK